MSPQTCTYEKTKKILNNENALSFYLLGAFIADGNVTQNTSRKNSFISSLSSNDKDWLQLIHKTLDYEGTTRYVRDKSYELRLYNKEVFDWFVSHNCSPNKSLNVSLPNIPNEYISSFIRGCMDGDGSISIAPYKASKNGKAYEQLSVYLCGASKNFMTDLSELIKANDLEHNLLQLKHKPNIYNGRLITSKNYIYRLQFSGFKRGVPFLKWIYDNEMIAMPRKQLLAKQIISNYQSKRKQVESNNIP